MIDWNSPTSSEAYLTESGEKMTAFQLHEGMDPMRYSASHVFAMTKEVPGVLLSPLPWHVIRPWIESAPQEMEAFWNEFTTSDSMQRRDRAVHGTRFSNRRDEHTIIGLAQMLHRLDSAPQSEAPPPGNLTHGINDEILRSLGRWVIDAVIYDHKAPKRLFELLTNPSAGVDPKGEQPSQHVKFFNAFTDILIENRRLPTKKAVRLRVLGSDETEAYTLAAGEFRSLGLGGLPEG